MTATVTKIIIAIIQANEILGRVVFATNPTKHPTAAIAVSSPKNSLMIFSIFLNL